MESKLLLSLGSNIEPRIDYLKQAIIELQNYFELNEISSIYQTEALDDTGQDDFYNLCVCFQTKIDDPLEIIDIVQNIENKIGRIKDTTRPKGPINIDIDIMFLGDKVINTENLTIPHKSMFDRNFVLIPLLEIFPKCPISNKNFDYLEMIERNRFQRINKIGEIKLE